MLKMQIWNASDVRVSKDPDHWDLIWNILSYNVIFRRGKRLINEKVSHFSKTNGTFGLGLLPYVKSKLTDNNISFNIEEIKKPINLSINSKTNLHNITLEDYQQKIIDSLSPTIYRGIFEVPTAGGKSLIAAAIVDKYNRPETLIFTPRKTILYGVHKELENSLQEPIGMVGDNIFKKEKITVGLYQSLRKYHKEFHNIKLAIVDEGHEVNNSIFDTLKSMTNTWYRFGLTGTSISKANKGKWFQVTAQIGPVIKKITDKQAINRVVPVEAYMFTFEKKSEIKNFQELYRSILLDEDRCELIADILDFCFTDKKTSSCLILVDEYKQAQIIDQKIRTKFSINETDVKLCWSKTPFHEQLQAIDDLSEGKLPIIIATPVFGVGTNIKGVESVINGSIRKSPVNVIQKIGRGRRRIDGKDALIYCDIYDQIFDKKGKPTSINKISERRKNLYKFKKWLKEIY